MIDDDDAKIAAYERFVGPAQGLADTANQFSCRADLLLWQALINLQDPTAQAATIAHLDKEYVMAEGLWKLAGDREIKGAMGEGVLRYDLHKAGVTVRERIVQGIKNGETFKTEKEVTIEVQRELEKCKEDYGMEYELAAADVKNSSVAFLAFAKKLHDLSGKPTD